MSKNKYKNFEDYLQWAFNADYAEGVLDDDLPDAFDNWITDLDVDSVIRFADDYAKEVRKEAKDEEHEVKINRHG